MSTLATTGGTILRKGRREMVSKTYKDTPQGRVYFGLKIDMPGEVSESDYKKLMVEFGKTLAASFEFELNK